jgi:hypothetical protein
MSYNTYDLFLLRKTFENLKNENDIQVQLNLIEKTLNRRVLPPI